MMHSLSMKSRIPHRDLYEVSGQSGLAYNTVLLLGDVMRLVWGTRHHEAQAY